MSLHKPLIAAVAALLLTAGAAAPAPAGAEAPFAARMAGDTLAVLYSGDGGWRALDQNVARHLADNGVPTVGIDSLNYFHVRRTPQAAAADLATALRRYEQQWGRSKIVLIGYSFGADALPAIIPYLPADLRGHVERLVLIGTGPMGDLQFHPVSWLDIAAADAFPVAPAIAALKNLKITCVYGDREKHDICPTLPDAEVAKVRLPGDHHFDRDYAALGAAVLNASR
ncbi:AcvB/VirJ family lysyl-phosphatidylglycerol hydrolase [Caulobacter sp.]|uniref:AcvB/VirJ family lysyl-phosphatidylglycerol hydrolase n=1 Tax=Caulobacter sp. TaxID=78 RepID=UPI00160FC70E